MVDQKLDDRQLAASVRQEFGDTSELRASLKAFGWHPEFPAVKDECGATLIGNRRLMIAQEEGIEPIIKTITFGDGKEADVERIKLALISNLGAAPFSPKDRKRIAEYLYGERGWVMQRIGEALGVSQQTIQVDLERLPMTGKREPTIDKLGRKNTGRPKGGPKPERRKFSAEAIEKIGFCVLDEGKTYEQAGAEAGVSNIVVRTSVAREEGRRQGKMEAEVDPSLLGLTAQEKLESAIRQATRKLEIAFDERVQEAVKQAVDEFVLPQYRKEMDEAQHIIKTRKGVMTRKIYRFILSWLHPDRVTDPASKIKITEAFNAFRAMELVLCNEQEMPTSPSSMPRNYDEMMKMREEVKAKRKQQKRQSNEMQSA